MSEQHRYHVMYGETAGSEHPYCCYDTQERVAVMGSCRKGEVIAEAQRRNGFQPVDGSEQTYARQTLGMVTPRNRQGNAEAGRKVRVAAEVMILCRTQPGEAPRRVSAADLIDSRLWGQVWQLVDGGVMDAQAIFELIQSATKER